MQALLSWQLPLILLLRKVDMSDPRFFDEGDELPYEIITMENSNDDVTGTNYLPTLSTPMQSSAITDYGSSIVQLHGSASQTARDVGTAVGTIRRELKGIPQSYERAASNAYTGNKVGTFWQYASPTDKAMIILAIVAIGVTVYKG